MAVVWPSKNNFVNGDVLTAANMNNIGDTLNVFNPTSATNGQVWVANGSGSGSYATPSGGMTLIQSVSLTSGTRHTVSSIPTSYQSLYIRLANCTVNTTAGVGIELNGVTSGYRFGSNTASSSGTVTADAWSTTNIASSYPNFLMGNATYNTTVTVQAFAEIHNYAQTSTANKTIIAFATGLQSGNNWITEVLGSSPSATNDAAITSVAIFANGATFTGGTFQVYGVK